MSIVKTKPLAKSRKLRDSKRIKSIAPSSGSGSLKRTSTIAVGDGKAGRGQINVRTQTLEKALEMINGSREQDHGSPENNFQRIADLWTAWLGKDVHVFSPTDVACLMVLMKQARLRYNPEHSDSWVDSAGYSGCGAEVSQKKPAQSTERPPVGGPWMRTQANKW